MNKIEMESLTIVLLKEFRKYCKSRSIDSYQILFDGIDRLPTFVIYQPEKLYFMYKQSKDGSVPAYEVDYDKSKALNSELVNPLLKELNKTLEIYREVL